MTISTIFKDFLSNIKISNEEQITTRYNEITKVLNQNFRNTSSETDNCLQVGSYGRWTAIKGISDLDMLYIMPATEWATYNVTGGQSKLLNATKKAIINRYPRTTVFIDRLVVCVQYTNFYIEVQPVFLQLDGSFKYPDTKNGGSWKITKPKAELAEMASMNAKKNRNLRRLCKMARVWRNKQGLTMGGLLIDTLAYNFLKSTSDYDSKSYLYYDYMVRDFFKYLANEPDKDHYQALGSNQDVKVKSKFQELANEAYEFSKKAIENGTEKKAFNYWRKIFGNYFPKYADYNSRASTEQVSLAELRYRHTEQFIEDKFPVDIRYKLKIESEISSNGYYLERLRNYKRNHRKLSHGRGLRFYIEENSTPSNFDRPYAVYWKVLNKGVEAMKRDCVRGEIVMDSGNAERIEHTSFNGDHLVECYIVQNGVVVARDRIYVPIEE